MEWFINKDSKNFCAIKNYEGERYPPEQLHPSQFSKFDETGSRKDAKENARKDRPGIALRSLYFPLWPLR
jgi:hypothetical protein